MTSRVALSSSAFAAGFLRRKLGFTEYAEEKASVNILAPKSWVGGITIPWLSKMKAVELPAPTSRSGIAGLSFKG
jgi:hypothetical protein